MWKEVCTFAGFVVASAGFRTSGIRTGLLQLREEAGWSGTNGHEDSF